MSVSDASSSPPAAAAQFAAGKAASAFSAPAEQACRPPSPRPKAPHLTVYRWPITMAMSIAHRAAGAALYAGAFFLTIYLCALAWSERAFAAAQLFLGAFIGQLILFFYTWALAHHMAGGIRHLFWDANPRLLEKRRASQAAWASLFCSLAITALIWAAALFWR